MLWSVSSVEIGLIVRLTEQGPTDIWVSCVVMLRSSAQQQPAPRHFFSRMVKEGPALIYL